MLDTHVNNFKYTEISPPYCKRRCYVWNAKLKLEEDQFEIKFDNSDQRKFLIPTAEVV